MPVQAQTPEADDSLAALSEQQQRLIEEHDGKAIAAAKVFARRSYGSLLSYDDFLSIARMALVKAARAFDPTRGTKFNTIAYQQMNWDCVRAVMNERRATGWSYQPTQAEVLSGKGTKGRMIKLLNRMETVSVMSDGDEQTRDDIFGVTYQEHDDLFGDAAELTAMREKALASITDPRLRRIFEGLLAGETYRDIGRAIGISYGRVEQLAWPLLKQLAARFGGVAPLRRGEHSQSVDAVDPSAADPGKPTTRVSESSSSGSFVGAPPAQEGT